MTPYPFSQSEQYSQFETLDDIIKVVIKIPMVLLQRTPCDFHLDISNINRIFALSYVETIDNLNLRVFQPRPCFELYTLSDGYEPIVPTDLFIIKRAIFIQSANETSILCLNVPLNSVYFSKSDGRWREIDYFEYLDKLNEARSIIPIKETTIDTSIPFNSQGVVVERQKICSTCQVTYKADLGYVARSVRYGDYVIWKAEDDTERCIAATILLKRGKPIAMVTLIFVYELQIAHYRFENDRWTYIDEEDYMKIVRWYKAFWPIFKLEDYNHYYWLMVYLCPDPDSRREWSKKSDMRCSDSSKLIVKDSFNVMTTECMLKHTCLVNHPGPSRSEPTPIIPPLAHPATPCSVMV